MVLLDPPCITWRITKCHKKESYFLVCYAEISAVSCVTWKKMKRARDEHGLFRQKSKTPRLTKTIRTTDENWEQFGNLAESQDMTRADLLENWVSTHVTHGTNLDRIENLEDHVSHELIERVIEILSESLSFRSNAGGKIKVKIREAISLLDEEE